MSLEMDGSESRSRNKRRTIASPNALVVFVAAEQEVLKLDISTGPCVARVGPRGGRLRPLASPFSQQIPDDLEDLRSLYDILVQRPTVEALRDLRSDGGGTVARVSEPFVAALAATSTYEHATATAERWLATGRWPTEMQTGGLTGRIVVWSALARHAIKQGLGLYCWYGPGIATYAIAHGVGEDSYQAYRRTKQSSN
jgi:hypothetical protein